LTDQQDQFVQQIRTNAEQVIALRNQLFERRKVQITEEGEKRDQQKLQWPPTLRVQPTPLRGEDAVAILAPRSTQMCFTCATFYEGDSLNYQLGGNSVDFCSGSLFKFRSNIPLDSHLTRDGTVPV
jgi:hypothetical protein